MANAFTRRFGWFAHACTAQMHGRWFCGNYARFPLITGRLGRIRSTAMFPIPHGFNLPVLFFTQLMGVAFGLSGDELGLKSGIVPEHQNQGRMGSRALCGKFGV